jgi:hypothetical protein
MTSTRTKHLFLFIPAILLGISTVLPAIAQDGTTTTQSGTTTTTSPAPLDPFGPRYGWDPTGDMTPQDRSAYLHFQYNKAFISSAACWYWILTGNMPESIADLYDESLIPSNIVNPVTGGSILVDQENMGPGDIVLISASLTDDSRQLAEYAIMEPPTNIKRTTPITRSITFSEQPSPEDMRVQLHQEWMQESLVSYSEEYRRLPTGIDEMRDAGYWPFDGVLNPVTGEPISANSDKPGDFYMVFTPDEVTARFIGSHGQFGGCGWPPTTSVSFPTEGN